MLQVKNVSKVYRNKQVLDSVNFTLNKGESLGLIGSNGAGKTTLLKIICGLINPTTGSIVFDSIKPKQIGTIFEDQHFLNYFSGTKNIDLFMETFPEIKKPNLDAAFKKYGLYDSKSVKYKFYSSGMKRRLDIMSVFLGNKLFFLLDEPTNGLDIDGISLFNDMVINLKKQKGLTFIISSHNTDELEKVCDRFLVIDNGLILSQIAKKEVLQTYGTLENAYHSIMFKNKG